MTRNDGADALGALISLGILGSMVGNDSKPDVSQFIKDMQHQQAASVKPPTTPQQQKPTHIDGANEAREIYEAYITVGFSDCEAFDLLKAILTSGSRK